MSARMHNSRIERPADAAIVSISNGDRGLFMPDCVCNYANMSSAIMQTARDGAACKYAHMDDVQNQARQLLDQMMQATGLDLSNLARRAKLAPSTLTRFYKQPVKHTLSARSLAALYAISGIPPSQAILPSQNNRQVPVMGEVGAGSVVIPFSEDHQCLEMADAPLASDKSTVAVIVRGDSMYPVFCEGDLLFYDQDQAGSADNYINDQCVLQLSNEQMLVKIITRGSSDGLYNLISHNAQPIIDAEVDWAAPVTFHDLRGRNKRPRKTIT